MLKEDRIRTGATLATVSLMPHFPGLFPPLKPGFAVGRLSKHNVASAACPP